MPNWIGDCVMSLPVLQALRYYRPQTEIYVVCQSNLIDLFQNIDGIKPICLDGISKLSYFLENRKKIRSLQADHGILLTNSFNSALLFRFSGIHSIWGYNHDGRRFLLHHGLKFSILPKHHIYFYLDLLEFYLQQTIDQVFYPELKMSDAELESIVIKLKKFKINQKSILVGISSTAAFGTAKEWGLSYYMQLIKKLINFNHNITVLLMGSKAEYERIQPLAEVKGNVLNLAGVLSLRETMAAIAKCSLFISNDSGLMHVASALRIPQLALFGSTRPERTGPLHDQARIFYQKAACAPCNFRHCPHEHSCMKNIPVDVVFLAAESFLNKKSIPLS
jgi:heptosyltransferase-2